MSRSKKPSSTPEHCAAGFPAREADLERHLKTRTTRPAEGQGSRQGQQGRRLNCRRTRAAKPARTKLPPATMPYSRKDRWKWHRKRITATAGTQRSRAADPAAEEIRFGTSGNTSTGRASGLVFGTSRTYCRQQRQRFVHTFGIFMEIHDNAIHILLKTYPETHLRLHLHSAQSGACREVTFAVPELAGMFKNEDGAVAMISMENWPAASLPRPAVMSSP